MKFIYRQLCAVFNGDLSYLPSQNIPDRTRFFDKPFLLVAVAIGSILMLPEMGTAQITFFSSGTNMRTAGNYTVGGLPTSSTDVLITTPSTQINISGGTLSAQSFNIINATSYILGDSTASAGTLAIGRTSFTNAFSGGMDEFLLANNSNLTIQPKVSTGTASLGVTLGGTANFNIGSGSTLTISSIITDLGLGYKIIKTGTGTLALSGVNTYTGIVIDTGIVSSVNGNTNFGTYPGAPVSNYITINGGIIQANGAGFSFNVNRGISLGTSGGTLDNNGFAIADAAVISGVGSLTKIGTGTLTVSIAATYTGNTNIQKDTLKAGLANALSASTVLNLGQTPTTSLGIFDLNANSQTIAGLNSVAGSNASALSNSVVNSSTGTPVLTLAGAGSYTFGTGTTSNSGVISTGVGITMSGSGLQVLGSINTYTGPTKINAGELRYALPAGSSQTLGIDTLNGGTLGTTGCGASSSLTFSTLALVNNSTISLGAAVHTVTFTTASFTAGKALTITGWTGAIANSGTAGKVFIGSTASLTTTQLSQIQFIVGAITYKATQLSTGEIVPISAETDLFQNSDMQVATNYTNGALPTNSNDLLITTPVTTPDISNGNITAQSLNVKNGTAYTIGDTSTTARVLTLGNAISFSNVISGVTNDVVSLSGNSSLTIKPTVGVTLSLALASSGNFDIATGSTLTDSAAITGTNSITKTGAGVLVLLAANTYSGNNTFSAGELRYSLPAGTTQSIGAATFNSGTLSTIGSGASSTLTFSSIVITNNSIINLDSTVVQTIKFTAAGAFTAGKILTINGWKGTFHGGAGTEGKIFIGTSASLTPAQLTHIQFVSGATTYNAIQLSTGEIVPFLFSQETDLFQNSDMQVATNYTNGALPTNTNDLLITTPVTTPNISNGNVTAQSLNVKNGTAYTITDTSVTPRILTLGNTTAFTNIISGVANDVLSLSGNSSLIVQPKIGGTTALSIALASSGNFDIATGSTFTDDSATITGTNSITKTGGGTLVLLGLNTYSGKTVINGGVIAGNNGNSNFGTYPGAPVSNQITINGATIQAFAVPAAAPFSFNANRGIVLGASGGTFDDNGFAMTDAAVISGTGSFTKIGTGVFNFTVASTYTGSTNIQQDTGRVGIANGIATTSVVNLGSASTTLGTLDLRFSQTIAGLNSVTGTNVSAVKNSVTNLGGTAATLTISGSGSYSFGNNTTTNSGVIVGGNKIGLTMSGTGLQVLGGVNAYTGTTKFAAGELRFTMPAGTTQTLGIATFAGGKLSTTGSGASSILSFTTINVNSSNDTLALETSVANTVKFTTATTVTSELTITGWQGTIGTLASPLAGTEGRVFVGASKILTALQLSQIQFLIGGTNYAATQLGTGEVVPINAAIATGVISPTTICAGTSGITIPFTYTPTASFAGATFTAQLSDVSGSFASPVILQSVATNSTGSQSISVTIPIATVAGTGYLIRVVSNIPAVTGTASSSVLTITGNTWVGGASGHTTDWNTATNWCSGVVPTVNTNAVIPGSLSFYPNITATSYVDSITISSGASVTVASGGTLSIHGSITNSGTFDATAGAIEMAGASAQSIGGSTFVSSTINNLIDSNTNASGLTINTADPVSITGQLSFGYTTATLNTNNALVLVSNATTTASIGQIAEVSGVAQATINGNVTIQRFYQAHRRWRLVTAPVQASSAPTISAAWQEGGQSIAGSVSNPNAPFGTHISGPTVGAFNAASGYDQSATNSASIAKLTAANSWFSIPNTFISLSTYQGYMLFVRGDRSFPVYTGTSSTPATTATLRTTGLLNTGRVTVPVNSGFTVVGNPYAATINFNLVYANSSSAVSSNSFSLWDPNIGSAANIATGTGGWVTLSWNGTSYDASPDPTLFDSFDINGDIQSGAAFAVDGTSGSVQIDEGDKVTGTDNHLYLMRPTSGAQLYKLRTTLYSTDPANAYLADGALNEFSSDFTNTVDYSKDIKKLFSFNERLSILKSGQNLSIQKSAPPQAGDTIHFAVASLKQALYKYVIQTIDFARPDIRASFVDSFTNTVTPILLGDTSVTVNFTVTSDPASSAADRFSIIFTATPPATVTYSNITATTQSKSIDVQWSVTNQVNTESYVVERSTDGINFAIVDTTLATPTDVSSYTYNWVDTNAVYGTNYYRVYTIGDNGAIQDTSAIASAVLDAGIIAPPVASSAVTVFPNPVTDGTLYISLTNLPAGNYGIRIISESGQVYYGATKYHGVNDGPLPIQFGKDASKGVYILEVIDPAGSKTKVNFENQ